MGAVSGVRGSPQGWEVGDSAGTRSGAVGNRLMELTDLLWACDPMTGARRPVRQDAVVKRLAASGQRRAARLAHRLPTRDGFLVPGEVDALLLRVHCELQRLGEELQLPRRVAETLQPWILAIHRRRPDVPVRVVDIGCGLGYVVRWLAAHQVLGAGVELVGVDLNRPLAHRAAALADAEGLTCRFIAGNALAPGVAVDEAVKSIVISTGLVHHLPAEDLPGFFAAQQRLGVAVFAHWDLDPSPWTTLGAWIFHYGRMREPVSRHDGVLSARRAHRAATLLDAARAGAPQYRLSCNDAPAWRPRISNVLRAVTGVLRSP